MARSARTAANPAEKREGYTAVKKTMDYAGEYRQHSEENKGDYGGQKGGIPDFVYKLLSVLIAFGLWFYVMGVESPSHEKTFTEVPVAIREGDAKLSVYYGYNSTVDITVQGKKSEINKLSVEDIDAYVDISSITAAGRYTVDVAVDLPGGVKLSGQSVTSLSVYLDNRSSVTVPIRANLVDYMLEGGYELGRNAMTMSIDEVVVTGPESVLREIETAQVNLSLGHVTDTMTVSGSIILVDRDGETVSNPYVKLQTTEAVVTVPVYITKTVPLTAEYKYGYFNEETAEVAIEPPTLRIKGEASVLDDIESILLTSLDEKKLTTDSVRVSVMLPANVVNVDGTDEAVISIKHINTTVKELVVDNITVNNPKNFSYTLQADSLNVTLRGNTQYLSYMTADNVEAVVDLSYLSNAAGVTSVAVSIKIGGVYADYVYELGDYKISVKIE